jgi:hypothetical protein
MSLKYEEKLSIILSGIQKCVRRGLWREYPIFVHKGMRLGAGAWQAMWNRLCVIALEDVQNPSRWEGFLRLYIFREVVKDKLGGFQRVGVEELGLIWAGWELMGVREMKEFDDLGREAGYVIELLDAGLYPYKIPEDFGDLVLDEHTAPGKALSKEVREVLWHLVGRLSPGGGEMREIWEREMGKRIGDAMVKRAREEWKEKLGEVWKEVLEWLNAPEEKKPLRKGTNGKLF